MTPARRQLLDMPMNTPFTLDEAALYLGVTVRTVQRAVASGKLKCSRQAGVRIKKEWLCEYKHGEFEAGSVKNDVVNYTHS